MTSRPIMTVAVRSNADVVLARQRAKAIAELAALPAMKQTSFATALSEIARNGLMFAGGARVSFAIESNRNLQFLTATVSDQGPGISQVRARGGVWDASIALEGQGIASARRLVKLFSIDCPPAGGTTVRLGIRLPEESSISGERILAWAAQLSSQEPRNLLEEMHYRNQELVVMLEELQRKESELERQIASDALLKAALAESKELLEARVKERTESLLVSNEELRAFSYTVSHDLRAPLRAVNGFISLIMEEHVQPGDSTGVELGRRIIHATERMDELVQDLVAYTQASKVALPLQELDCRVLIGDLLKQCEGQLEPENARAELTGEFPTIIANPGILHSVLLNLFENALKFRKKGQPSVVRFRGEPTEDTLRLWIEDDGIGIAPQHHDRIFGVFERLHGGEIAGTGIGLALVKRWLAGMRGAVGVESNPGEGARFWIELPLSSSP